MLYGQGDDESIVTEYLDAHLEGGIKQKNLDKVLDLIDEYVELREANDNEIRNYQSKLKKEREYFVDYLGSCTRYLDNKRIKDIKYQG